MLSMNIDRLMLTLTVRPSELNEGRFIARLTKEMQARGGKIQPKWDPSIVASLRERACTDAQRAAVEALRTVHYLFPATNEHARELLDQLLKQDAGSVLDVHVTPRLSGTSYVAALEAASIVTPEFVGSHQSHHDPAPTGINTRFAWQFEGANGSGVHVFIMEGGWSRLHPEMTSDVLYDLDAATAADAAA